MAKLPAYGLNTHGSLAQILPKISRLIQNWGYLNHSGAAGATFGNIVAGGLIGWGVDSATGSDNKYDSPVNITLPRK